ncbi:class I SAM-dependent methyltransferase [Plantactinospora siamensis]|uniref:Class I SAM-dependent methyltransferase n=1 Tax=Plantactinospora siamensis TaxID=555372 RepID=A0ABV6NYI4_9ACTN
MTTPWMIDELDFAGPEHLDPAYVAGFDRKSGTDPGDDVALLRAHGLAADATVVDLAAGTGTFTLAIAPHVHRVVAADVSPAMLTRLTRRAADTDLRNITVEQAGFLSYRHTGPAADAVHTRHALHQLPDLYKPIALHRIAAILRPGGLLRLRDLIFDVSPAQMTDFVDRWLAGNTITDPAAGYTRADLVTHLRTEFSTYRWLFEPMLDAAGFDILDADYRAGVYAAYTCVRR